MVQGDVWKFALGASRDGDQRKNRELSHMNELSQSLEREGSRRFGFLSSSLASLTKPSVAVWAPIPLRLIVGYGFMARFPVKSISSGCPSLGSRGSGAWVL
jgi:hypothetical protein